MTQRIVSACVGFCILGLILFLGNNLCIALALLVLSMIGLRELYKSFNASDFEVGRVYRYISYMFTCSLYLPTVIGYKGLMFVFFLLYSFLIIAYGVLNYNSYTIKNIAITTLSMLYVPLLFWVIYNIFISNTLKVYFVYILLIAFATDTFAYFSGVFVGKRKIAPILSPNKTLEGCIGGTLGCLVLVLAYAFLVMSFDFNVINLIKLTIFSLGGSFVAQIGDLFASSIKRHNSIKDYGKLMPGHGGVLDRFDSVLFVAPYVYMFAILFLI